MDRWTDRWMAQWQSNSGAGERLAQDLLFYVAPKKPFSYPTGFHVICRMDRVWQSTSVRGFLSLHFFTTHKGWFWYSEVSTHQGLEVWGGRTRQKSNVIRERSVSFFIKKPKNWGIAWVKGLTPSPTIMYWNNDEWYSVCDTLPQYIQGHIQFLAHYDVTPLFDLRKHISKQLCDSNVIICRNWNPLYF